MDPPSDIRSVELSYKSRHGDLIYELAKAGHHPKVTVVLLGERSVLSYRIRLSCTRCQQTWRRWPLSIWWGLSPSRACPASPSRG
jgi:hypothetical protein